MKILFIDPDQTICDLFKATLGSRYNSEIVTYTQGKKALEYLNGHTDIDIVACDYVLPDMQGAEFYRFVRENHPSTIFILQSTSLLTIKNDPRFYDFFDDIYLNRAISRPFTPNELFWVIGDNPLIDKQTINDNEFTKRTDRCNLIIDAFITKDSLNSKLHVRSLNINRNGMFIMCDNEILNVGDVINYEVSVDFFDTTTKRAIVRWKRESTSNNLPTGVGVEFI